MKPFDGIRVLDLTHVLAGPFSTYQLACMGADVIKIESPSNPDMTRAEGVNPDHNKALYGSYFQSQNAGKRAVTINLKTKAGCEVLWRLIDDADVLVQNYAGDSLEQLGFGYQSVSAANPEIIYCSISGFGTTGPKADHPAYDVVIQAFSGIMAANGEADSNPVRIGPPMVDYGTGSQAAFAISAALFQRQQTGRGQFIDVAMLDAALMLMSATVVGTIMTSDSPKPHGNEHPTYVGYATYDTADGQIMLGAWTNKQLSSLFNVLGEHDRARDILAADRSGLEANFLKDQKKIKQKLKEKTADEWEHTFNRAHVPAARVRELNETIKEEQLRFRGVLKPVENNEVTDPALFPVTAFTYAHGTPGIDSPPPKLGQHTQSVLREAGYSDDEIKQLSNDGVV